jgi:hypothetical protein
MNFGVIGPMNGAFDRSRNDFLRAVIFRCVLDDPVTQQRPVLHQTKHTYVPPDYYFSRMIRPGPGGLAVITELT